MLNTLKNTHGEAEVGGNIFGQEIGRNVAGEAGGSSRVVVNDLSWGGRRRIAGMDGDHMTEEGGVVNAGK